jgi:hypothetical protein
LQQPLCRKATRTAKDAAVTTRQVFRFNHDEQLMSDSLELACRSVTVTRAGTGEISLEQESRE